MRQESVNTKGQARLVAVRELQSATGENWKLRFYMNTEHVSKILISRATVPPPISSRCSLRVAIGGG